VLFGVASPSGAADSFSLKDTSGRTIEIEVKSVTPQEVQFISKKRLSTVPLAKIEDRESLIAFAQKNGLYNAYPKLDAQVTVRDKDRRQEGSRYMRDVWITPILSLVSENKMEPLQEIEAVMFIICENTKSKYRTKKKEYQFKGKQKIKIPGVKKGGDQRTFEFDTIKLEFDEDRNRSNLGGWVYKYYLCMLTDPKTGDVITYRTNFDRLEALLETNPAKQKACLEMRVGDDISRGFIGGG